MCEHNCNTKSVSNDLVPVSRESLQGLRAKKIEESRIFKLKQIVNQIYVNVTSTAGSSLESKYMFPASSIGRENDVLYEKNLTDIISGLQTLFPECSVKYVSLIQGSDGKMHDISNIEKNVLPFVNINNQIKYIVVDWS